jgi:subtilisin family serine protease
MLGGGILVAPQGTSMAAPVVTGSVTLVRQYFVDGFYPSGAKEAADAYTPSGPLVKAALLGGASNMLGNTEVCIFGGMGQQALYLMRRVPRLRTTMDPLEVDLHLVYCRVG